MATNPFDKFDGAPAAPNPFDKYDDPNYKPSGAFRRGVTDKVLGVASGALGLTKAIADSAGADNQVSQTLDKGVKGIDSALSPEAQADRQQQASIMDEAKGKGVWDQVKAGASAFGVAPVQTTAQGVGSAIPFIAASLAGAPVAAGMGVAAGVGTVKGSIFEDIKKRSMAAGMPEAQATAAATKAQEYSGANQDQIALGGVLGAADALTGVSRIGGAVLRNAAGKPVAAAAAKGVPRGVLARAGLGAAEEMPLEALQGGQEQFATNVAANRAGFGVDPMEGVVSNATLEALASAGPGAGLGALNTGQTPPAAPLVPPTVGGAPGATPPAGGPPAAAPTAPMQEQANLFPTLDPIDPNANATSPTPGFDPAAALKPAVDPKSVPLPTIDPEMGPISKAASLLADGAGVVSAPDPVAVAKAEEDAKAASAKGKGKGKKEVKPKPVPPTPVAQTTPKAPDAPAAPAGPITTAATRLGVTPALNMDQATDGLAALFGTPKDSPTTTGATPDAQATEAVQTQPQPASPGIVPAVDAGADQDDRSPEVPQGSIAAAAPADGAEPATPTRAGGVNVQPQFQTDQGQGASQEAGQEAGTEEGAAGAGRPSDQPATGTALATTQQAGGVGKPKGLSVTFAGKTYPVESVEDAQRKWSEFRDSADGGQQAGVSQIGNGVRVTDQDGNLVARISYNGRAWDGEGLDANEIPMPGQRPATLMDKMTDAAGGPVTFGDIRRADQEQQSIASSGADSAPERWAASGWASAPYEDREQFLRSAGFEPESQEFKDAIDSAWNGLNPSQRARLAPAINAPAQPRPQLDDAAHAAATSPRNALAEPTDAQKEAGNYPKGHVRMSGMDLTIENPEGSVRSSKAGAPVKWQTTMKHHYGYIRGTIGNDKDHVDVFIKPGTPLDFSGTVFVVDQVDPKTGAFDEHKIMIGFENQLQAKNAYQSNYAKGWKGMKSVTAMPFADFKEWVFDGPKNTELAAEALQPVQGQLFLEASEEGLADALADAQSEQEDERLVALFNPQTPPQNIAVVGQQASTQEEANKVLERWKAEARKQGKSGKNSHRTVISLFDYTGNWAKPWAEAGFNVITLDLQNLVGVSEEDAAVSLDDIRNFSAETLLDEFGNLDIWAILAAPPCTDFSSSGAQYWAQKDADGRTEASNELVRQVLRTIELFRPPVWAMENPVGRMAKLNGLPKPLLTFQPNAFGDPYTKKTQIWGNFNNLLTVNPVQATDGSKITEKLSSSNKVGRSETPEGFAYSFFMANNPVSGFDHPGMTGGAVLAQEFHGIEADLFSAARFGNPPYVGRFQTSEEEIRSKISDAYNDGDLDRVRDILAELAADDREPKKDPIASLPKWSMPTKFYTPGQREYTTKEAQAEWDKKTQARREAITHRIPLENGSYQHGAFKALATKNWDEQTPAARKVLHAALNEDFYDATKSAVARGMAPPVAPVDPLIAAGEAWNAMTPPQKFSALLSMRIGGDGAEQGKYATWSNLSPDLQKTFAAKIEADPTLNPLQAKIEEAKKGLPRKGSRARKALDKAAEDAERARAKAESDAIPDDPEDLERDAFIEGLPLETLTQVALRAGLAPHPKRFMMEAQLDKFELAQLKEWAKPREELGSPVNNKERAPDVTAEQSLLCMPCSEGKLKDAARADQMYQGVMWQSLRAHQVPGATPRMVILSAEHGFIDPGKDIDPYERQMTDDRRDELLADIDGQAQAVRDSLPSGTKIRDVMIVGGAEYRAVMRAVVAKLIADGDIEEGASVNETTGGIGEHRQQLGQYLDSFQGEVRETITPADDTEVGVNDAGEKLYERKDGTRYRMRDGRPDFGGDLAPVEAQAAVSPLVKAMNDLADVRARIEAQGRVADDRLLQRERQLVAIVKELEAEAPAAAAPADRFERDKDGNRIFKEGERVKVTAGWMDEHVGKHGEVIEVGKVTMRSVMLFSGRESSSETSYHYNVRTDGGHIISARSGDLELETGEAPKAVPDIRIGGIFETPGSVLRSIDYAKSSLRVAEGKLSRAKTEKSRKEHNLTIVQQKAQIAKLTKAYAEWAEANPDAAPKPVAPAAPSPATSAAAGSPGGAVPDGFSLVKTKHTKTGEDIWVVKMSKRLERDAYNRVAFAAKAKGGSWSKFTGGFNFASEDGATEFLAAANKIVNPDAPAPKPEIVLAANEVVPDADSPYIYAKTAEGWTWRVKSSTAGGKANPLSPSAPLIQKLEQLLREKNVAAEPAIAPAPATEVTSETAPAPAAAAAPEAKMDDLSAMFDDLLAEELGTPAQEPAPAPEPVSVAVKAQRARAAAEAAEKPPARPAPRTATQAAVSAVGNTVSGMAKATDALAALFGGGKGTIRSGLSFDEETYARAKPLFQAALADFKNAAADIREAMREVIRLVMEKAGPEAVQKMKPYIVQFIADVQAGKLDAGPQKSDTAPNGAPNDSGTEGPGGRPLEDVPSDEMGGAGGGRPGGPGTEPGGNGGGEANPGVDGQGGEGGRGAGNGPAGSDLPATRAKRPKSGGAGGGGRARSRVPGNGRASDVGLPAGSDGAGRPGAPGNVAPAGVPAANFTIDADVQLGSGGETTKYRDNIAAIKTLKLIESEHRRATAAEKRVLARYVGWGGLANAFRNRVTGKYREDWLERVEEVESLLTPKELNAASASTQNAHYTSSTVVNFMWRAAQRMGFAGGLALEPSVGTGNFIGLLPQAMRGSTRVTGIELDSITARIAGALYPQSTIIASGIEKLPLPEDTFDLVIGNPPFGRNSLRFQYNPKLNGKSIHNQFFLASLDALKPGGLQVMVVSRYLMDAGAKDSREAIAMKAELLGAVRLPGSAFKGNANTSVVTDVLFLRKRTVGDASRMMGAMQSRGAKPNPKESSEMRRQREADQAYLERELHWTKTGKVNDPLGGEPMEVSQYYVDNPKMIAGVMDRSGSMQYQNDLDVKLPAAELPAKLDALLESLPSQAVESPSKQEQDRTEELHKALGESLSIMASGREVGSIYYDEAGDLVEIIERIAENGRSIVTKQVLTENSPWSNTLSMNMQGLWFKEVPKLDEKGEKVKVKNRNVMVREVYKSVADIPSTMLLGEKRLAKLKKLVEIRELYVQQINLETNRAQAKVMEDNRAKLREAYEAYVKAHGYLNDQTNASIISEMPDEGLILSLELKYRPAVTVERAKRLGIQPAPARAEPNAILSRPVSIPPPRQQSAESMSDAVAIVLGELGRIDIDRVAELRGVTADQATEELTTGDAPLAYMDPETNELTEKNQYLSGNVRRKLNAAREAKLSVNIKALEAVQPEPWSSDKVTAKLGATWVPAEVYSEFVTHLLGEKGLVRFSRLTNTFEVRGNDASTNATQKWGTARVPAPTLLQLVLNSKRIAVYDQGGRGESPSLNETETQSANDKKAELIEEFDAWIFKDADRRQTLTQLFNDHFNTRVNRQYDGSHMKFPGKVPDSIIKFRRNQINAIWRGVVERFTMYDHAVGAGKTFTGIARAIERRRMGLSRKPMIVVPNHLVAEWSTQAYRLYPGAKILAAGVKDLEPKNRRRLFAKIAAGDWDVVIVPHSSFKFIGIAPETEERYLDAEIAVAQQALAEAEEEAEPGQRFKPLSVKAAEALIDRLEERLDIVRGKAGKDSLLTFEQMGVDDLTVDESHEFKNLTYTTKLTDVRGLGPAAGSQKAFDLYTKMRVLHENGGSGLFMSGTPISNSAVEMYTIMRYLAPNILAEHGLEHFDAFRAQFVDAVEKLEPTEAGDGLKLVNRLGRNWSNMRALMDAYYSVADVVTNEDIQAWFAEDNPGKEFPLPKVKGGKRRTVKVTPTPTQQALLEQVVTGYNALPYIQDVKERNKERLRLMTRARKVSLHARVLEPTAPDEPGSKLDAAVDEAMRIYKKWSADRGTQLFFLDRSVPKSKGDDKLIKEYDAWREKLRVAELEQDDKGQRAAIDALERFDKDEIAELRAAQAGGWNAYQHMADLLMSKGVPASEIAFIQDYNSDAEKKALFESVNDGSVRFLFGSSQRMGAGMNVQQRLVGLHHVDVGWKPSDIEQREGRIIRQGNLFATEPTPEVPNPLYRPDFEVEIMAYVTERSIDAKMWDLNSTKLRMVNGIRYYDGEFEMDFEDDEAIDMAEIAAIASGDPLMLDRIRLNAIVEDLYRKRRSYSRRVEGADDALRSAQRDIERLPKEIAKAKALIEPAKAARKPAIDAQAARSVKVNDERFHTLAEARTAASIIIAGQKGDDTKAPFKIEIDGKELKSEDAVDDALADKMGDIDPFLAEIGGKEVMRRTAVGRHLREVIGDEFRVIDEWTPAGTMYGLPMAVRTFERYGDAYVELKLDLPYSGGTHQVKDYRNITPLKHKAGKTVPVNTTALRALVDDVAQALWRMESPSVEWDERKLEQAKASIPGLQEAVKEQFKFSKDLEDAMTRLDEVERELASRAAAAAKPAADAAQADDQGEGTQFARGDQASASLFRRGAIGGMPTDQVRDIIGPIADRMNLNITVVQRPADLPIPAPDDARGLYINGQIYVVAANVTTRADVLRAVGHEAIAHLGLRSMLGREGWKAMMNRIQFAIRTGNKPLREIRDQVRRAYVDEQGQSNLTPAQEADEIAAAAVEQGLDPQTGEFRPGFGWLKSVFAKVVEWLRSVGVDVPFSNIELQGQLVRSMRHLEGGARKPEGLAVAAARGAGVDDQFAAELLSELGAIDEMFRWPASKAGTLEGVFADTYPAMQRIGDATREDEMQESGADARTLFRNAAGKDFYVYEKGREVWADVSRFDPGQAGDSVYHAIANYAHNTGKVFVGDPQGLSPAAIARRTYHMLGSAIRFGTTKHFQPAPEQLKGLAGVGIAPLEWSGNDGEKLTALVKSFVETTFNQNPNLRDYSFDLDRRAFADASGAAVSRQKLLDVATNGGAGPARVGGRAAAASVLLDSLARQPGGKKPGLLALVDRRAAELVEGLGGPLFARGGLASAQTLSEVTQRIKDATSPIGTVSLWDKTVGTQYHKATKDADFKKVFDGYVQQTDDTAHYAIEAERLAPSILMRLESVGDVARAMRNFDPRYAARQKADLVAVSKALFANIEGETGVKQVRYDERSLREIFNLTPKQIEMYYQARAAVDQSIERLAQTFAAQMGRDQGLDIERVKNYDLDDTVAIVKEHIQDAHDQARAMYENARQLLSEITPEDEAADETSAELAKQMRKVPKGPSKAETERQLERLDQMVEHARFLQENAYMPAMRFGQYAVTVADQDGEVQHFEMFESQMAANLAAIRLGKEYSRSRVHKSVMNPEQYAMFKGVSPETVELFAKFTGMDQNEAYQDYIALAKSARSVKVRELQRKGIAGFSEDATRVMASFLTSNARQAAINVNIGAITDALSSKSLARKGDVQREAQKLHEYMSNPLEEARRVRGFLFMHFIGGSIASAMVNLTQPVLQTAPYLSQFAKGKTARIMASAARMATSGKIEDKELRAAARRAAEDGITEPHEIHQLMADASGSSFGGGLAARAAVKAWGGFFSLAEAFNRRLTFLAAYQTAKETGEADPYEFARKAVIETQGLYAKANRPNWARGPVGATLFTFKQFSISYVEFIQRMPRKQKLIALAVLLLVAGAQGLPFAEDVEDLIDTIGQSLGYNTNSKKALRQVLVEAFGDTLGEILNTGVFSQTGVDVHGRLGMGNLIPGTAIFLPSETDKSRTLSEVAGPLGGILMSMQKALAAGQRGDLAAAGREMAPVAVKNLLQGADMAKTGVYKDSRGYKVTDVDAADSFYKMLGLQPGKVARETRKLSDALQDKSMVTMMEGMIADRWAAGVANKEPDQVAQARATLAAWNANNPDFRIVIKPTQIMSRVKKIRETRADRFIKTVPREVRGTMVRELQ